MIIPIDDNDLDLKGKMYDNSLYTRVSDPDMLLISVIHFYAKSFIDQATVLANGKCDLMETGNNCFVRSLTHSLIHPDYHIVIILILHA